MRCEDFPCCGHEPGCCPDFDASGRQLNMKCVCGATVPLGSRSSLCEACLRAGDPEDSTGRYYGYDFEPVDEGDDDFDVLFHGDGDERRHGEDSDEDNCGEDVFE